MEDIFMTIQSDKNIKLVSFDIFDTLVFRGVARPVQVFEYMYKKKTELFPDFMNEEDWRELRCAAERLAKKELQVPKVHQEVQLSDIYARFPDFLVNTDKIMQLEIECEKELCFINPYISQVIRKLYDEEKYKIVLISDMYLSQAVLREILIENGFDFSMINQLYVSSEYDASKIVGDLYKIVLEENSIESNEMFHVGDNVMSDIGMAKALGIKSFLYDVISSAHYRYPYMLLESIKYGNVCAELFSLRQLVASNSPYGEEEKEWFDIGCMVLGPVFTGFIEWVLDTAEKQNIKQIFPIMRDGKFLTELLLNANEFRSNDLVIKPLYSSRKALYSSILNIIEKRDLEVIASSDAITINAMIDLLNVTELLPKQYSIYINDVISEIRVKNISIYKQFMEWITSEEIVKVIRERNVNSDELLLEYLLELGCEQPYITLDIGWRGNIGDGIQRMLLNHQIKSKNLNLLMFGALSAIPNVFDNSEIRGYIGSFGKNLSIMGEIFIRIFECFVICDAGTTMGYQKVDGVVRAITEDVDFGESQQFRNIRICQEGMLAYQKMYLQLKKKKSWVSFSEKKSEDLCKLMARVLSIPSKRESELFSKMYFDQNLGINKIVSIVETDVLNAYKSLGLKRFLSNRLDRKAEWYSGMNVLRDPFYHYDLLFRCKNMNTELKIIYFIKEILEKSESSFVVVGAGNVGKKVLTYFNAIGLADRIEGFADNNTLLQKVNLYGKPVRAFDYEFITNEFIVGTLDYELQKDIQKNLIAVRGNRIKCYGFYDVVE